MIDGRFARVAGFFVAWMAVAAVAGAQATGYGVIGLGGTSRFIDDLVIPAAAGVELGTPRWGVGGEFGVLGDEKIGSGNITVHFGAPRARTTTAFLTGGVSLMSYNDRRYDPPLEEEWSLGLNVGGGAHIWVSNRVAVRLEFRDHLIETHYWVARAGIAFR